MDRAEVTITGGDGASAPAAPPEGHPQQEGAATAPEAQPPVTAPPPQGLEPDRGGPVISSPTPDQIVAAEGGSMSDQLRARFAGIASTKEFPVPGWELANGEPGLIVEAKTFGDRKKFNEGISNEAYIARSTHRLFFVQDDGKREEIAGGWGPGLATLMGLGRVERAADLVSMVISKPDPNDEQQRIPNVAGIAALATMIINWAGQGQKDIEDELGG